MPVLPVFICGVIVGFIVSAVMYFIIIIRIGRKLVENVAAEYDISMTDDKSLASLKEYSRQIAEITDEQNRLIQQVQTPSLNASHSRWKNDIRHSIIELENKKHEIFKAIIKEGHNPPVTVFQSNGTKITMKMSEAVEKWRVIQEKENPPKIAEKTKKTNKSHLRVIHTDTKKD